MSPSPARRGGTSDPPALPSPTAGRRRGSPAQRAGFGESPALPGDAGPGGQQAGRASRQLRAEEALSRPAQLGTRRRVVPGPPSHSPCRRRAAPSPGWMPGAKSSLPRAGHAEAGMRNPHPRGVEARRSSLGHVQSARCPRSALRLACVPRLLGWRPKGGGRAAQVLWPCAGAVRACTPHPAAVPF